MERQEPSLKENYKIKKPEEIRLIYVRGRECYVDVETGRFISKIEAIKKSA